MTVVPIYVIILYRGKGRAISESSSNVVPEVVEMKPNTKANIRSGKHDYVDYILCDRYCIDIPFCIRWDSSNYALHRSCYRVGLF